MQNILSVCGEMFTCAKIFECCGDIHMCKISAMSWCSMEINLIIKVQTSLNPLTPMKKGSSLIFVKNSEIAFGPRKSKSLEFFRYLFLLPKFHIFYFRFFLTVHGFLMNIFCHFLQCKARTPMNSTLFEFCWYLLPFLRYKRFNLNFYPCASQCTVKYLKSFLHYK